MLKLRSLYLFILLFPLFSANAGPYDPNLEHDPITIITYNIQTNPTKTDQEQTEKFLRQNTQGLKSLFSKSPDIVNLQEVPLSGIQWLEKNYGQEYSIVYAPKRAKQTTDKINDYSAILYKKSRFQTEKLDNMNHAIKTKYFTDNRGEFMLHILLNDLRTKKQISVLNAHIAGGIIRKHGDNQVKEIVQLTQKHPYAIIAADFNGKSSDQRIQALKEAGFVNDPVLASTEPGKNRKMDHILFKANHRSKFLDEECQVLNGISGSDHYPLSCRVLLQ